MSRAPILATLPGKGYYKHQGTVLVTLVEALALLNLTF